MNTQVRTRSLRELVEEHVRQWKKTPVGERQQWRVPNIAISREAGTTAEDVAQSLADSREMQLYGDELLHQIAQEAQVDEKLVRSLDERGVNFLEDMIQKFLEPYGLTSDTYLKDLLRTFGTIDWCGNGIIVGRGAAFALRGEANLRVRFVAPLAFRAQRYAREHAVTEARAREVLKKLDEARTTFVRKAFNVDPTDPLNFDLVLNAEDLNVEEAADLVGLGLERKQTRAGSESAGASSQEPSSAKACAS